MKPKGKKKNPKKGKKNRSNIVLIADIVMDSWII